MTLQNGFVEEGEECDCGLGENPPAGATCAGTKDPCCTPTCTLLSTATCSELDACCTSCQIVSNSAQVCRGASGQCDLAETCDGATSKCPADFSKTVGSECTDAYLGTGACFSGGCVSHVDQCKRIGSIYKNCADSIQLQQNNGNFCMTLWCEQPGGSCTSFLRDGQAIGMDDGTICGTGSVCQNSQCVGRFCDGSCGTFMYVLCTLHSVHANLMITVHLYTLQRLPRCRLSSGLFRRLSGRRVAIAQRRRRGTIRK
jgi:hypothetical protein